MSYRLERGTSQSASSVSTSSVAKLDTGVLRLLFSTEISIILPSDESRDRDSENLKQAVMTKKVLLYPTAS